MTALLYGVVWAVLAVAIVWAAWDGARDHRAEQAHKRAVGDL